MPERRILEGKDRRRARCSDREGSDRTRKMLWDGLGKRKGMERGSRGHEEQV